MARNTHPEKTRMRILDAARTLFLTKGYDNTSIQDILNELTDLSKGAIYHHFSNKQAILDALTDIDGERLDATCGFSDASLNGLQKLRSGIEYSITDQEHMALMREAIGTLGDAKILAENLKSWRTTVADLFARIIEEGIADGSITTNYPTESAQLIALLTNYWLTPSIYPATMPELRHRIECFAVIVEALGLPLFDDDGTLIEKLTAGYAMLGAHDYGKESRQ